MQRRQAIQVIGLVRDEEIEMGGQDDRGNLGGFFQKKMRWPDYVAEPEQQSREFDEALYRWIVREKIWCGGGELQANALYPRFSDGSYATYSQRAWGDLMAAVWSTELNVDFSYVDFYGQAPEQLPGGPSPRVPTPAALAPVDRR